MRETSNDVEAAIERYIRSKSKSHDSGYYRSTAATVLTQWVEWLQNHGYADFELLGDEQKGPTIMRRYAQRLDQRVTAGGIQASSAKTYWSVIGGFLSYAMRDGELAHNPAITDRAREPLPYDDGDRSQQFWDPETRTEFLRYLDDRASQAIEDRGSAAIEEARDRALVYLLAFTGVRGAEVFRSSHDDREGRQGLRWRNVDLEAGTLRVFGKSQEWEPTPLPRQAQEPLARYQRMLAPPTSEWPVFPTRHAPSLYRIARTTLPEAHGMSDSAIEDLLAEQTIDAVLREYEIVPPAITVDGVRRRLQTLCEAADITIDGEYLKLHGARRGIGDTIYRHDRGQAQDLLRHRSLETTRDAYQHIEAQQQADELSDLLEDS